MMLNRDSVGSISLICLFTIFFLSACGDGGGSGAADRTNSDGRNNTATLSWAAPIADEDGGDLTGLAGYRVYYGPSQRTGDDPKICDMCGYTTSEDMGLVTTATIPELESGTYYFSVSAYDASGNESRFSEERSKTIN